MSNPNQAQPISGPVELQNLSELLSNLLPGVQTVVLKSQNVGTAQGTYVSYTVNRVRRRMLTVEEILSRTSQSRGNKALVTTRTLIWEFWDQYLLEAGAPIPKPGDLIFDVFGTKYIVMGMNKIMLNLQLYSAECEISPP